MSEKSYSRLRFIDAWKDEAGTTQVRSGYISPSDFDDWLALRIEYAVLRGDDFLSPEQLSLRLVVCENAGSAFSLGCSQAMFQRISKEFQLHETTEEAFINNNGTFSRYIGEGDRSGRVERVAMVIKIPRWAKGCEAISLSYDCRTQSTRAFLQWIPDKEHDELVDFLHDKSKNPAHRHPLFLPARILCNHRRRAETYRIEVDRSILRIELFVGYAVPGQLYHKPSAKQAPTSSVEGYGLEDIVRRLHASSTELGGLSLEATFGKELGAFLMATERELAELGAMALDGMPMRVSESVMDQVKFNSNLFLTMGNQVAILKERVQNHINLTFSLIAQEENKLNRTIAENSKRDSAAMKTIAVLTMFFLPPTFVASLFSMSMFDWNSDKPGSGHMSKYFWVYWAVAAPLTIIVLIFWRVWWKLEERRHGDGFHKAKQG